jgi:hypothetical protein
MAKSKRITEKAKDARIFDHGLKVVAKDQQI